MFRIFELSTIISALNIAINTRMLLKDRLEGIGWFTYESFIRITQQHPEHQFYFLFDRKWSPDFVFSTNITPIVVPPPARHPILIKIWYDICVPFVLKKINADLFVSPDAMLSLNTRVPTLLVIHDLNFEHYPNDLPRFTGKFYRNQTPKFAAHASRIATVSEFSKNDIVANYGTDGDKIDVVYNGANENFHPIDNRLQQQTRLQYSDGIPYFLFVGSLHPRKNLANLFKAFDIYCTRNAGIETNLLIVGERRWWTNQIQEAYNSMLYQNRVRFTGRVSTDSLHKIVASALTLTYVSNFEGFGIPIIEAFRCGTPVITSNVTSMPEIAGGAALLTDPSSPESISDAMKQLATDKRLRDELVQKGLERAKAFSWNQTADKLWDSMNKITQSR
ncbi:MAG TPA: glycosyltransferase family 1 protein [Bacteroidales bacterium]|nr:glycosyltransferase family 1 protein [Bacteroidales bacterium]